jgi:alanine-glyoxylate transaminase / serine-glyoxylate transaminase / serine-pyruvate transaminase
MGHGRSFAAVRRHFENDTQHSFKAVLACHNETATGVTSDIAGVREALDDAAHPALLFVDCVSSLGCIDFRFDEWGVDMAVSGSQKGLMLPAGLGILCASPKALDMHKTANSSAPTLICKTCCKAMPRATFPTHPRCP